MKVEGSPDDMEVDSSKSLVSASQQQGTNENFSGIFDYVWKGVSQPREGRSFYTEIFTIGTYEWRLFIFPHGNNTRCLSVYLDCPECNNLPSAMCPTASFQLVVVNQVYPDRTWRSKEVHHAYNAKATDWGFNETLPLNEFYDINAGFLKDDTAIIKVELKVEKDDAFKTRAETGFVGLKNQGATCYMNSLLQYLYNINYFRWAVYHMPTTESEEYSNNMPLALQNLFFRLQYAQSTVSTKNLTKSFGWTSADAFMQHDVQELNRVLCEKLEEKMKGTQVEKAMNQLFEGHMLNYIECINVDYKSERKESFMDIQLDVKGCKDIYDSFDRYVQVEVMDGPNQYHAEQHGLQDAKKGVLFEAFPPVLQLQLKRFEYDFQRDIMVKINDRYEFYDELDLDREDEEGRPKYLSQGADTRAQNKYRLHSVLVHSGGVHGGHYYAYVRPDGKQWLRFDDEHVTKEEADHAMRDQFGEDDPVGYGNHMRVTKHSNAYMLVYVRISDWDNIMCPAGKIHLQDPVRARFEQELKDKHRRQQEKMFGHMFASIKVATDVDIRDQIQSGRAFDLVDHEALPESRRVFRVNKKTTFGEFRQQVESEMGVPVAQQRLWLFIRRPNGTVRVSDVLHHELDKFNMAEFFSLRHFKPFCLQCKTAFTEIHMYLETPSISLSPGKDNRICVPKDQQLHDRKDADVLLFCKLYLPQEQQLTYVGRAHFDKETATAQDVAHTFARMAGLPQTAVEIYEEVKPEPTVMASALDLALPLRSVTDLKNGDIFIIQPSIPAEQAAQLQYDSVPKFLEYVQARRIVLFKPLLAQEVASAGKSISINNHGSTGNISAAQAPVSGGGPPSTGAASQHASHGAVTTTGSATQPATPPSQASESFLLELQENMSYEEVTQKLAERLGMYPPVQGATFLRLTQHNQYTHGPQRASVQRRQTHTLQSLLATHGHAAMHVSRVQHSGAHQPNDILYYEVLDMPLDKLEQLKTLKVTYHKDNGEPSGEHVVRLPKDATVAALLEEVGKKLPPPLEGQAPRPLRLVSGGHNRVNQVLQPDDVLDTINDTYWKLRVESVCDDEQGLDLNCHKDTGDRLIPCLHCTLHERPLSPGAVLQNLPSNTAHFATSQPPTSALNVRGQQQQTQQGAGAQQDQGLPQPPSSPTAGHHPPPSPFTPIPAGTNINPNNLMLWGEPVLVRCRPKDKLKDIKARLFKKLGVSQEDANKWTWLLCNGRAYAEVIGDDDDMHLKSKGGVGAMGPDTVYLAMEHEDERRKKPAGGAAPKYVINTSDKLSVVKGP